MKPIPGIKNLDLIKAAARIEELTKLLEETILDRDAARRTCDYLSLVGDELRVLRDRLTEENDFMKTSLKDIATAEGCEGYGEVLGGKLMEKARLALSKLLNKLY